MLTFVGDGAKHVGTTAIGGVTRSPVPLANGNVLIGANIGTAERIGMPLHELRSNGEFARSFRFDKKAAGLDSTAGLPRQFFVAGDGRSILMAIPITDGLNSYGVASVSLANAAVTHVVVNRVPWMTRATLQKLDTVVNGRSMRVAIGNSDATLVGADPSGLLWMNGWNLTAPYTPRMAVAGVSPQRSLRLEVIDPRTRQVLASSPFSASVTFLPGSNLAYSISQNPDGVLTYTIWRLSLRRP